MVVVFPQGRCSVLGRRSGGCCRSCLCLVSGFGNVLMVLAWLSSCGGLAAEQ